MHINIHLTYNFFFCYFIRDEINVNQYVSLSKNLSYEIKEERNLNIIRGTLSY